MFSVLFSWFCLVVVAGELREVSLPVYAPPSEEEMISAYFRKSEERETTNRTRKSILSESENLKETVEVMRKELSENIGALEKELSGKNGTEGSLSEPVQIRTGVVKKFFMGMIEPTTYRYPTAVWSSQTYEKLKSSQRFRPGNGTRVYAVRPTLNPAYVYLDGGYKGHRRSRGKTKWKESSRSTELESQDGKNELADRFLEQSLDKYLTSSNLRDHVGNVSVKTFSDILKNITETKPKRLPYDENKELRMRFREEVILKKKNETKPQGGFLEKQLQRRLEKVQDVFNEKDKDKILANMWRYATLNKTTDLPEEKKNTNPPEPPAKATTEYSADATNPHLPNASLAYATTEHPGRYPTGHIRGTARYHRPRYETTDRNRYHYEDPDSDDKDGGANANLLTAEETAYYRRGQFPRLTFIGQPEKPGVIPGRPLVDYPVHNFPPATKFKCPKFKGGKPRMMADPETRCQVFYICTGDGPTTAMLCPNGTMFNEKFLVCDWWYNVNCRERPKEGTMPTFELVILYRQLNNTALKAALKRSAGSVFESGATIRNLTNLGLRDIPYYITKRGTRHNSAHYFVFDYDCGVEVPRPLREKLMLDVDVLRASYFMKANTLFELHFPKPNPECTMHLDLLPPPHREKIIQLQATAKEKARIKLTHKNYEDKQFLIF